MPIKLSQEQVDQLLSLGINVSNSITNTSKEVRPTQTFTPSTGIISHPPVVSSHKTNLLIKPHFPLFPLFSLSSLSLLSFGGLFFLRSKINPSPIPNQPSQTQASPDSTPDPSLPDKTGSPADRQVPKSIQHYLLTSQQYFTQALTAQSQNQTESAVSSINQSILTATEAIKSFPTDFRGWEQRGRIYLSLSDSQPQLAQNAISDLQTALSYNPSSAELTRSLASLFAKKGDALNTLTLLAQTVAIEPTRAQNFYDLARLQQQVGLLPEALSTYSRLLTLITDPGQKTTLEAEVQSLQKLVAQNTAPTQPAPSPSASTPSVSAPPLEGPLIQASADTIGPIIAAPETRQDISVSQLSSSNSLSGTGILLAGTPSLTLQNTLLTPLSQVYLTTTKGGKNLSLQVLHKSKDSFTVGLPSPASEDIEFKWWIVNP